MYHIAIKVFWWSAPKLVAPHERDVARLVRWFGLDACVLWLRNSQNDFRDVREILTVPPPWENTDVRFSGWASLFWAAVFRAEKFVVAGFVLFLIGGTIYVGDISIVPYLGGAILIWWLLYFGSLFIALKRWRQWLVKIVAENETTEPGPTENECREIVARHKMAAADIDEREPSAPVYSQSTT